MAMVLSRPQTMQEAVLVELRRRINDGEFRPGDAIRVDFVAEALGVSRIRSARR